MEISGDLSVTFKVKSAGDLQRITEICKEYDGQTTLVSNDTKVRKSKAKTPLSGNLSKEETAQAIIDLLKSTFPRQGFLMRDAVAIIQDKLDRKRKTTQLAINWARNKGIIMMKGHAYYFTDFVQERVAAKMQDMNQGQGQAASAPIIPAGGPS